MRVIQEIMELRSAFVPQFEVRQSHSSCLLPKRNKEEKRVSLLVRAVFSNRDTFTALYCRRKNLEVHCNDDQRLRHSSLSKIESSKAPELSFNRLQLTAQEYSGSKSRNFGAFVARMAMIDEEYWTAAWLRAEAHWESFSYMRHVDSYKRKYADQGETYPGEIKKVTPVLASRKPYDAHKYAYVANVCVAKFARQQGIATNMLYLASDLATSIGMKQLFVHVNADNKPAQELYKKTGFQIVDAASSPMGKEPRLLMSMELQ